MLRAGLAARERLPVPHHSEYSNRDDDETFGLNGGKGKGLHRRNPSWLEHDYRIQRSLTTRIVTKPCRSLKTFLVLVIAATLAWWYLTSKVKPGVTTFIFHEADTRRVWEWEIQSGHWMSWRPIKEWFHPPRNPSLPSPSDADDVEHPGGVIGCGWQRRYVHIDDLLYANTTTTTMNLSKPPSPPEISLFPPRPVPGSIVDFDIVNQYCDHATGQYLRTCLAFLRLGAHLDTLSPHLRIPSRKDGLGPAPTPPHFFIRTKASKIPKKPLSLPQDWRYCYLEDRMSMRAPMSEWTRYGGGRGIEPPLELQSPRMPGGGVPAYTIGAGTMMVLQEGENEKGKKEPWDVDSELTWEPGQCEEEYPRIVHMSWEGEFGDAPYMALLSFLYSQNLGLDRAGKKEEKAKGVKNTVPCRPQFWMWIRDADETWEKRLASNSWSMVYLEEKFSDIIKFKRWNATEQMDATPELAGAWRDAAGMDLGRNPTKDKDDHSSVLVGGNLHKRSFTGPDAASRLHSALNISVADTARWVLPHRYGGVYVEPGLLFLRDWEELWNYRGSFSTKSFGGRGGGASILRLNKNSALGTVVLRTASRHGMRLDSKTVQRYAEDAGVDQMLFPIPDMLQNLAFWSGETSQKQRPAVPSFDNPQEFFEQSESSLPATEIGVSGFFRGAWFYHAHPERDMPFDLARNYAGSSQRSPSDVFGPGDRWDVPWCAVFKRTLEAFIRGEQPNMYGEWLA